MAYTYEFKQPDGSYKTQTVDTDMSQSAGYLSGNIRPASTGTVSGTQGINQVNTPTNPIQNQPQTPIVNTNPTNQISTGQNTMFRVNDQQALENLLQQSNVGIQEFEKNYITRNADGSIYLKPAGLKLNTQGLVSQVNTPITRNVDIPTTIPQKTFSALNSPSSLNDIQNRINSAEDIYNQALNQFEQIGTFDPLTKYQELQQQTGVLDLQKQLANTDNALRNLEDDIRRQYAGREISESQIQALIAKQSEPILRTRQYLADQVNNIMSSIENQIQLGQQGFTNRFNQALQVLGLKKDTLADLKTELNNQLQLARQGRLDEIDLAMTLAQLPKDFEVPLSDGTILKGGGFIEKNIAQIQETDADGRVTVSFIDTNPDSDTFGQVIKTTDLGIISTPEGSEYNELLSPTEAANLGVPYGTTKSQAMQMGIIPKLDQQTQARVDKIANQFDGEQVVKNFQVTQEGYEFAKSLSNTTTSPADDIGLIYAFAKAMDPNSVVREGEYATVQKYSQSWLESFGFNAARVVNNMEFLTEQARENLKKTIESKYKVSERAYKNVYNEYGRRIDNITGEIGTGTTFITDYSKAFNEQLPEITQSFNNLEGFIKAYPEYYDIIEDIYNQNPNLTDAQIQQKLISGDFNKDLSKSKNYLSNYGNITGFGSSYWKYGLDVDLKKGDPVYSPVSGTVIAVGSNGGFGNQVKIKGNDGREYWLSHLDGFKVRKGQKINAGSLIGIGGNTGKVIAKGGGDGSHLDITIKDKNGNYIPAKQVYNLLV